MASRIILGPAGKLHLDDGGAGPGHPIVFVPSFAGSTLHWAAQLEYLRRTRQAVALDLRGQGLSARPATGDYSMAALAEDIEAVVDALRLDEFILIGHSMGGSASIAYASLHPDRVMGLMLVATPGKTPLAQSEKILAALSQDYEKVAGGYWTRALAQARPEVVKLVRADITKIPRDIAVQMIEANFAFDPVKAMRTYPGPCLVVNTPHADTPDAIHKQIPDLPFEAIEGTSHWLHMDKPGEFNEILQSFIEQVETGATAQPTWHTGSNVLDDYRREY